jgi:hypothetical protein
MNIEEIKNRALKVKHVAVELDAHEVAAQLGPDATMLSVQRFVWDVLALTTGWTVQGERKGNTLIVHVYAPGTTVGDLSFEDIYGAPKCPYKRASCGNGSYCSACTDS